MQCTNGHDNPDGQKFCGACGAPIPDAPVAATLVEPEPGVAPPPTRRGKRRWIALALAVIAIVVIVPGQTAAYGETIPAAGATRMEVQALVGTWQTATSTTGAFTASGVSTTPREYLGLQTNATLSSTFAKDLKSVVAVAIYRDAGGAIVGGDRTFVDFVPTGGSAAVEITSFSDLPAPVGTEVYAELSTLSLLGT